MILMQNAVSEGEAVMALMALILLAMGLLALVLFIWGMIFKRAGYSFAMALLMFIPIVNMVWLLIFAFSKWPIQRELEAYRQMQAGGYGGVYPPAFPPVMAARDEAPRPR